MNVCTECNGNPFSDCPDISVWTKAVDGQTDTAITNNNVSMAKNISARNGLVVYL